MCAYTHRTSLEKFKHSNRAQPDHVIQANVLQNTATKIHNRHASSGAQEHCCFGIEEEKSYRLPTGFTSSCPQT